MISETKVSLTQLERLKVDKPDGAGSLWMGIPHDDFVHACRSAITAKIGTVGFELYGLSKDKRDLVVSFAIYDRQVEKLGPLVLTFVTSNARRQSTTLYVGAMLSKPNDIKLDSAMFAEIPIGRKREGRFNLDARLNRAMDEVLTTLNQTRRLVGRFDEDLGTVCHAGWTYRQLLHALMIEAARERVIPWSRLFAVDKALRSQKLVTSTSILRVFSEVIRRSPVIHQPRQLFGIYCILQRFLSR